MSARNEEGGDARFDLSRHAALKSRTGGDVLVLPERAIRIGGSGGEILRLCEGGRSRDELVREMKARYPSATDIGSTDIGSTDIEREVDRFLSEMLELGGITRVAAAREESPE